jgi:hypothetical protein
MHLHTLEELPQRMLLTMPHRCAKVLQHQNVHLVTRCREQVPAERQATAEGIPSDECVEVDEHEEEDENLEPEVAGKLSTFRSRVAKYVARRAQARKVKEVQTGKPVKARETTLSEESYNDVVAVLAGGLQASALPGGRRKRALELARKRVMRLDDGRLYQVNKVHIHTTPSLRVFANHRVFVGRRFPKATHQGLG